MTRESKKVPGEQIDELIAKLKTPQVSGSPASATSYLAARLEQASKKFQARLLISEAVRRSLDGIAGVEDLGSVELKGQPHPARVFKLA